MGVNGMQEKIKQFHLDSSKSPQKASNIFVRSNRKYISFTAIVLKDYSIEQVGILYLFHSNILNLYFIISDISHTGGIFNIFKANDVLMLNSTDARIDVSDLIRQVEIENLGSCRLTQSEYIDLGTNNGQHDVLFVEEEIEEITILITKIRRQM